ncbi:MAG: ORF6N domain-containing protein [Lachnospiraceae bacterium]|jgi:hypothetical protein|nr:ORF6N domain-containing protein [Lachnospiraceae bacterium]
MTDKSAAYTADIKNLILTIRGKQVLLDHDVARLYGYETMRINEAARRNIQRFPENFRFQLTETEYKEFLISQNAISSGEADNEATNRPHGGRRSRPYAYTEQGIGMLSGLLKNETAVHVSIGIMNAFVEMRQIIHANKDVFAKLMNIDTKLIEHDQKFGEVFDLLRAPNAIKQSIFYKGQFYDAFKLVIDIFASAKASITVIDNYVDNTLLDMLAHKQPHVSVTVITASTNRLSKQHLQKFEQQYGQIAVVASQVFHDRFVILDDKEVYAFGASLKDLGNKCFEVSKNEDTAYFISYVNSLIGPP